MSVSSRSAARRPRSRRILFSTWLALIVLGILELISYAAHGVIMGEAFSWASVQGNRERTIDQFGTGKQSGWETSAEVPHPYLGYLPNPERGAALSEFGYPGDAPRLARRSGDRLVIAVVGGSAAQRFAETGLPLAIARLERSAHHAGKEMVVANLAAGGYKQPQQLMTLNYLLVLGYEFDVVVNLDGFNEVALHSAENGKKHIFPIYPRSWYTRVAGIPDRTQRARMGRVANLEQRIASSARLFSARPWRWSVTANLTWGVWNRHLLREHVVAMVTFNQYEPPESPYLVTGPRIEFSEEELYAHMAAIWKRSSLQLDRLCRANGIRYYHLLQPNQYLPGSKPLTQEEREEAYLEDHPYRAGVLEGYPLLKQAGTELVEAGVRFVDLTALFESERRTVYSDDCCHFNDLGNELIAVRLAAAMLADDPAGWIAERRRSP